MGNPMRISFFSNTLKVFGIFSLSLAAMVSHAADSGVTENISTPSEYCRSKADSLKCLKNFTELWNGNLQKRMEALKNNCLENTFCTKQLTDLDDLWNLYGELLGGYLASDEKKESRIAGMSALLVNLQYHILALGYGCSENSANCVVVDGEKQLSYNLQHLVSYYTGLGTDVLFEDPLREAAIMEIDDMLNAQYRKIRSECSDEPCRSKLKQMEISWIKYKEKMLNYLEDPLASGSDSDNYFLSDMFLILTSLHQTRLLGFTCPDGELKCIVDEQKLRDSAKEFEKDVVEFEGVPEVMPEEKNDAPAEIDATDYGEEKKSAAGGTEAEAVKSETETRSVKSEGSSDAVSKGEADREISGGSLEKGSEIKSGNSESENQKGLQTTEKVEDSASSTDSEAVNSGASDPDAVKSNAEVTMDVTSDSAVSENKLSAGASTEVSVQQN